MTTDLLSERIASLEQRSIEVPCLTRGLTSGCWVARNGQRGNYMTSQIILDGRAVTRSAHTTSYLFHRGDYPAELYLDHLCHVRSCWNPWHLEPVTPQVNSWRMHRGKRLKEEPLPGPTYPWLSRRQAVARLGLHIRSVDRMLADGRLTRYHDRLNRVRISVEEVETLLTHSPELPGTDAPIDLTATHVQGGQRAS